MTRIVYTSYYSDLDGGGELRMLDHILNSRFGPGAFSVLLLSRGDLIERLAKLGIHAETIPWTWAWGPRRRLLHLPRATVRIVWFLLRSRPKLVICNTYLDLILVGVIAALLGFPVLWRSRAEIFPKLREPLSAKTRIFIFFLNHFVRRILPTTSYDASCMARWGVRSEQVAVLYNGVDRRRYASARDHRETVRGELGLATGQPLIGFVARLTPLKGHRDFFAALDCLRRDLPEFCALVVGYSAENPDYHLELESLVGALGLKRHVRFTGFRADIAEIMAALDLLVVASHQETFGTTIIEAMAAGCPVVSTATDGAREIIEDGRTGGLVPIGEPERLAEAMREVLLHPDRARALVTAAYEKVRADFDLTANLERFDRECEAAGGSLSS